MRIPETIKIGPFTYKVLRPVVVNNNLRQRIGEADHENLVIKVEDGLAPEVAAEVFFHEVMHAVDVLMGTKLKETQVERMSKGLYMVLKDNSLLRDG